MAGIPQGKKSGYGLDELNFPQLFVCQIGFYMLAEGALLKFDPIKRDRPDKVSEPVGNHGTDRKSIPKIYRKIRDNHRGIPELISRVYL